MSCIIQVIGRKDSGKTSAIEKAVKRLKAEGKKVAVIKHSHHEIDLQGKDTYRFWNAGADIVLFNDNKCVAFYPCDISIISLLPVDVVIVEGYKDLELGKKIEIKSPEEIDYVSERIYEEAKNCHMDCKIILDGKITNCDDFKITLLYNLLKMLNVREVKID